MLASLDRVDGLARHIEPPGQFSLAPVAFSTQHLEAVFHDRQKPSALAVLEAILPTAKPEVPSKATSCQVLTQIFSLRDFMAIPFK